MLTRHVTERLAGYCDGELSTVEARAVEAHLARCARCRTELEDHRATAALIRQLEPVRAPEAVWYGLVAAADTPTRAARPAAAVRWALACGVVLTIGVGLYWASWRPADRPWQVDTGGTTMRLAAGEWLEAGPDVRPRILVGDIGVVDVEPGSRLRLGEVGDAGYRMELTRGTVSAQIDAPPRLFIVDTPASTVVDLGCAYTVSVADDGSGVLRMSEGWAALEWNGRESLVPAGAICRMHAGRGPGVPYFEDAPAPLQAAVDAFDAGRSEDAVLDVVLREARPRDTLTLWHLLSRVDEADRPRVYARMTALVPPPPAVTRERVLRLDPEALRLWRQELAWTW